MDFYTNLTFKVQKGRGLGHMTKFLNLGTPLLLSNELSYLLENWHRHRRWTPTASGL